MNTEEPTITAQTAEAESRLFALRERLFWLGLSVCRVDTEETQQ